MSVSDPGLARLLKRFSSVCCVLALFAAGALYLSLGGCAATWQAPAKVDDTALRARAVSVIEQDVRLSAAVLSAEDSRQMLGADVNGTGIQPVWIEVENPTPQAFWLLHSGTDPDYFSPLEVAWSFHAPLAGAANARLDDHFATLAFENPIPARSTRAGIIFTNPHRRIRLLNADLLGRRKLIPFTLFLPVPDDTPGAAALQVLARFARPGSRSIRSQMVFHITHW